MLKRRRCFTGFTLVELLITIAIVGVLAAIALPSFTEFIARSNLRSSAESILNALQLARAEAVRRNEQVTFSLNPNSTGATSWRVADSNGNLVQESRASGEGGVGITVTTAPAGATTVIFNGFGRVVAGGLTAVLFESVDTTTTSRVQIVQPGGQIRMCDPSISATGDPRRCLP